METHSGASGWRRICEPKNQEDCTVEALKHNEVKDNVPLVYTVNIIYIIYIVKGGCSSWQQKH